MQVDAATAQHMAQSTGMVAMPSNAGIHALRQCVALALPQVLVMHGRREPMTALVNAATAAALPEPQPQALSAQPASLSAATQPAAPLTDGLT